MFRQRARPEVPDLDRDTAERLLDGAPTDDLPDPYGRVAELLAAASGPATPDELHGATAAAAEFVTAHDTATRPPKRRRRPVVAIGVAAGLVVASAGTAVAAVEGALPQPVQAVAHDALDVVGISVPGVTSKHDAPAEKVGTPSGHSVDPVDPGNSVDSVDSVDHGSSSHGAKTPTGATSDGAVTSAPPAGNTTGTVSPVPPTPAPAADDGKGAEVPPTPGSPATTTPGGNNGNGNNGNGNGNGNANNGNGNGNGNGNANNGNGNNGNGGNSADHRQNVTGP